MNYPYTLRIVGPDEIDADLWLEIDSCREPGDTDEQATRRWLGSFLVEAEQLGLPDGWYVKVDDDRA